MLYYKPNRFFLIWSKSWYNRLYVDIADFIVNDFMLSNRLKAIFVRNFHPFTMIHYYVLILKICEFYASVFILKLCRLSLISDFACYLQMGRWVLYNTYDDLLYNVNFDFTLEQCQSCSCIDTCMHISLFT